MRGNDKGPEHCKIIMLKKTLARAIFLQKEKVRLLENLSNFFIDRLVKVFVQTFKHLVIHAKNLYNLLVTFNQALKIIWLRKIWLIMLKTSLKRY